MSTHKAGSLNGSNSPGGGGSVMVAKAPGGLTTKMLIGGVEFGTVKVLENPDLDPAKRERPLTDIQAENPGLHAQIVETAKKKTSSLHSIVAATHGSVRVEDYQAPARFLSSRG